MRVHTYTIDSFTSLNDKLLGSDYNDNFKTRNYTVQSLINLINSSNSSTTTVQYRVFDGSDPEITLASHGYLFPENAGGQSEMNPSLVTKFRINKFDGDEKDLTDLFQVLDNGKQYFVFKFRHPAIPNEFYHFRVNAVTIHESYAELDVTYFNNVSSSVLLRNNEGYNIDLMYIDGDKYTRDEIDALLGAIDVALDGKTDKGGYAGTSQNLKDLIDANSVDVGVLQGMTLDVNQAAQEIYLKDGNGVTLATLNVAFLNNEGTTFFYNDVSGNLELHDFEGNVLSVIPVSSFVGNLASSIQFNGTTPHILELKDNTNTVISSVTVAINNVQGLQAALDAKLDAAIYTAADILAKLITVDGAGSGLDADTVDGKHASEFATSTHNHTLDSLSNVVFTSKVINDLVYWDGVNFVNGNLAALGIAADDHNHDGVYEPVFTKNTAFNKNFGTLVGTVAEGNHLHDSRYSQLGHNHNGVYALVGHNHDGVYEPVFIKNTAFNKNFGTTNGTVAEGSHTHDTIYSLLGHTHTEADITDLKAYLLDAPSNGSEYARKDGAWVAVSNFTPSTLLSDYGFTDNSVNWNTAFGWGNHSGLYVGLNGNQTVNGIKTFSSFLITPSSAPTTDYQVANKKYVDDAVTAGGGYTDEQAQDAVGGILIDSSDIDFTYDDPLNTISASFTPAATTNISNGVTAYGWGNHALAGYLAKSGTPLINQVALFVDANTVKGTPTITSDATSIKLDAASVDNATLSLNLNGVATLHGKTRTDVFSDLEVVIGDSANAFLHVDCGLDTLGMITLKNYGTNLINSATQGAKVGLLGVTAAGKIIEDRTTYLTSLPAHTHTFASLTSKPTTIAGYGITDAYTKTEVDAKELALSNADISTVAVTGTNTKTITLTLKDGSTVTAQWTDLDSPPDGDEYIDALSFNSATGVLTAGRTGALPDITASIDGRYSLLGHNHDATYLGITAKAADSDKLDGLDSSQFLRSDVADVKTSGNLTLNTNVRLELGTSAVGGEIFYNGTHNYWKVKDGDLIIQDNATPRFTFTRTTGNFINTGVIISQGTGNSSFAGNVGIGIASPQTLQHINSASENATVGGTSGAVLRLTNTYAGAFNSGGEIQFGLSATTAGRDVLSAIKGTYSSFSSPNYGGNLEFYTRNSDGLGLKERMVITETGEVGIGTSSPSQKFHLEQGRYLQRVDSNTTAVWQINNSGNTLRARIDLDGDDTSMMLRNTSNIYTVRLDSGGDSYFTGGNLGIGVGTPSETLHISNGNGTTYSEQGTIAFCGDVSTRYSSISGYRLGSSLQAGLLFKTFSSSPVDAMLLSNVGYLGIGTLSPSTALDVVGAGTFSSDVTATNFNLSSDKRLKTKIKSISADEYVDVNWKTFKFKNNNQKRYGVIAQELEKKHPEFVRTNDEGMKSVAYIDLLIAKIAELEARLEKAGL